MIQVWDVILNRYSKHKLNGCISRDKKLYKLVGRIRALILLLLLLLTTLLSSNIVKIIMVHTLQMETWQRLKMCRCLWVDSYLQSSFGSIAIQNFPVLLWVQFNLCSNLDDCQGSHHRSIRSNYKCCHPLSTRHMKEQDNWHFHDVVSIWNQNYGALVLTIQSKIKVTFMCNMYIKGLDIFCDSHMVTVYQILVTIWFSH